MERWLASRMWAELYWVPYFDQSQLPSLNSSLVSCSSPSSFWPITVTIPQSFKDRVFCWYGGSILRLSIAWLGGDGWYLCTDYNHVSVRAGMDSVIYPDILAYTSPRGTLVWHGLLKSYGSLTSFINSSRLTYFGTCQFNITWSRWTSASAVSVSPTSTIEYPPLDHPGRSDDLLYRRLYPSWLEHHQLQSRLWDSSKQSGLGFTRLEPSSRWSKPGHLAHRFSKLEQGRGRSHCQLPIRCWWLDILGGRPAFGNTLYFAIVEGGGRQGEEDANFIFTFFQCYAIAVSSLLRLLKQCVAASASTGSSDFNTRLGKNALASPLRLGKNALVSPLGVEGPRVVAENETVLHWTFVPAGQTSELKLKKCFGESDLLKIEFKKLQPRAVSSVFFRGAFYYP